MILQIEAWRFILVFFIGGIIISFFSIMIYILLNRAKNSIVTNLVGFFLFTMMAAIINIVYSLIQIQIITLILAVITTYIVTIALIFLYIANYTMYKSEKLFPRNKQLKIAILYGIILVPVFIFPFFGGIELNEATNWSPKWNLFFFLYMIIAASIAVYPNIKISAKIYKEFQTKELRWKYLFYVVGTCGMYSYLYGIFINNFLNITALRNIFSLYALSIILWSYLVYYGIGKQPKQKSTS